MTTTIIEQAPSTTLEVSESVQRTRPDAVGRRKTAIARVRLVSGTGKFSIKNNKRRSKKTGPTPRKVARSLEEAFPNKVDQQHIKAPLVAVGQEDKYDIIVTLRGGGVSGQAGALQLAIARALIQDTPDHRPVLKKAGYLTRDDREVESKKYGLKKARKAPQYSKR